MDKTNIPEAVCAEILSHVSDEGHIEYLGTYRGSQYFRFVYEEDFELGFPVVCSYKVGKAETLESHRALSMLRLLLKD